MNITEIETEIKKLEEGPGNFTTCQKLASLYIVKYGLNTNSTNNNCVVEEFKDILPQYRRYCDIKKQYQLNLIHSEAVESSMKLLCQEIKELIEAIYYNTNTESEKTIIKNMLQKLASL